MNEQILDDQLEPIYNSSVPIQDIAWKSSREQWTSETGGRRGSGRSVLAVQHDNDRIIISSSSCSSCSSSSSISIITITTIILVFIIKLD